MDKTWIDKPHKSTAYLNGVLDFIEFAVKHGAINGKFFCPCKKCYNSKSFEPEVVSGHLVWNGFLSSYREWVFHGESLFSSSPIESPYSIESSNIQEERQDHMKELIQDAIGDWSDAESLDEQDEGQQAEAIIDEQMNDNATRYHNLIQDCDKELYPSCKNHSKISFLVHLYHIKILYRWSDKSFSVLLKLLKDAFPEGTSLPSSSYEAKKLIKELGLGYEKIHACPNDCILYWREWANQETCHVCGESRWMIEKENVNDPIGERRDVNVRDTKRKKRKPAKPAKVLRYFPLIPRLKRLYLSSKTASSMKWHDEGRTKDGMLRHPADGIAWKSFDERYPEFAAESRNVRLGLASDGFNPYRTLSSTYSIWPVILIPYNLPPWLCMKQSSFILSMIIPGEKGPGNDIDIYLQPLVEELKQLWVGVDAFDASIRQSFKLRASLLWTINDFPAYANLSGWSTKGHMACPACGDLTHSRWLYHGGKHCYMGHRRWLSADHPFRYQKDQFDGTEELQTAPIPLSGIDVLKKVENIDHIYGKKCRTSKKVGSGVVNNDDVMEEKQDMGDTNEEHQCWKKRSIFFDLDYWKYNSLRHNLDVMHIEKNVCDNFIGTFLNLDGKTKDNLKARQDLQDMNIRKELHPQQYENGIYLPPACYTMSLEEKDLFLTVLKNLKVPDGYASNISRCVNLKERKLSNLKSHDSHILMQDILPIAIRTCMPKEVVAVVCELSSFFKTVCSKSICLEELDQLEVRVATTLCEMEKIFVPGFFTIMVHLIIHLVHEVRLGGPVQYRWMFPIERTFVRFKSHVRNKALPEGCIAEGYIADECLIFCSRYLEGVETTLNRPPRNYDIINSGENYMFLSGGRAIGKVESVILDDKSLAQAHRYVLLHNNQISCYRGKFLAIQRRANRNIRPNSRAEHKLVIEKFANWLQTQVPEMINSNCSSEIIALARGPNNVVRRFNGFVINGFRFHTRDREKLRKTQNSGVMVEASGQTYYGVLTDIFELDYFGSFKVVMFRCDWVDVKSLKGLRQDAYGFNLVSFSKLIHTGDSLEDDPFVFSSQVKQVFYVQHPKNQEWWHVIPIKPRDLYDMGLRSQAEECDDETYTECIAQSVVGVHD